jgi:hypothetical protein
VAGVGFHGGAEEAVDARLIAFAAGFEPGEDVGVEAHGEQKANRYTKRQSRNANVRKTDHITISNRD